MADPAYSPPVASERPPGVPGYPGPYAVGRVAGRLRDRLRGLPPVCVIGEVTGARVGAGPNVYFELRDSDGALPCAMWRDDFERTGLSADTLRDGAEVVAAGGFDYYPGSATSSPRISFRVKELRPAGEGDLLAQLARLRRQLAAEGLFEPQKLLPRAALPRRLGVVTAAGSAACRDCLAGLERLSWRGTIFWGHAPVQDRRAAPAIEGAIRELAAVGGVEAIVVTRGGGSIADLWAFCDETLCRTVALTPVPVISAVGHEIDRTLIDDVAAVSCSTPTHAAEAAVRVDCGAARERLARATLRVGDAGRSAVAEPNERIARAALRIDAAARIAVVEPRVRVARAAVRVQRAGRAAVLERARALVAQSRAPRDHLDRHRLRLHQLTREMRAAAHRGRGSRIDFQRRIAVAVLGRRREAALLAVVAERELARGHVASVARAGDRVGDRAARLAASAAGLERARRALEERRAETLASRAAALRGLDPERTLERGYAVLLDERGEPLAGVAAVRAAGHFEARLADGSVGAQVFENREAEEADER
ncbi:MAG: exodeoxyribonuclease large subunit [Thermoleophilaceae bacterium]|nr:exodeoxyribonuclease large subunit [Thermoleophilaceae bacterium]